MDFEGVFVLIGLALYVWSLVRKRRKKKKAAVASAPKQGLLSQVSDKIRLFVGELEKQAVVNQKARQGAKDDSNLWDRLSEDRQPRQREYDEVLDEEDAPLEWELDSWEPDSVEVEDEPAPAVKVPPPPVTTPSPVVAKPVPVEEKSIPRPSALNYTPATLRNAVVWSEILSPPLALRKDDHR